MNSWNFTGNIGNDAETRHIPSGEAVVGFNVAVKSGYGDKAVTTWVRCAIWGKRGEAVAPYLLKGQLVGIVGEVTNRKYEKDGQEKFSLDVRVSDLTLLGKKDEAREPATRSAQVDFNDPIPF
ncbi:MAG: single-stranded DNA-binding protein [Gammaproteobacteria bacterium]|jgi:single-strand DNA-binding protein|nr:single-stranded DNA-binding protein [Gammaproteobacteria bacterium]